jgi:hypothetical protein
MILFASSRIGNEWATDDLSLGLRPLVQAAADYLQRNFSLNMVVTCLLRTAEEDAALYHDPTHVPGVHVVGRGADISVRNLSSGEAIRVVNIINDRWSYDPARPNMRCALYETTADPGVTGPHIHIQVHPNTVPIVQPVMA